MSRGVKTNRWSRWASMGALALIMGHASQTLAQQAAPKAGDTPPTPKVTITRLDGDAVRYAEELTRLESKYQSIPEIQGEGRIERYYLYGRGALESARDGSERDETLRNASILLFGSVEPPLPEPGPLPEARGWYGDALKALADTYLEIGNVEGARTYYKKLLGTRDEKLREHAVVQLIEMASAMRDTNAVQEYIRLYEAGASGSARPPQMHYALGRMYFLAKDSESARSELNAVPAGDAYYLRAQYMLGALLVRDGKLVDALRLYDTTLRTVRPVADEDREVREMCHLARGRLYYELDKHNDAVDAYNYIGVDSDNLATMLYEVIWTYVRRASAIRTDEELDEKEREELSKAQYRAALERLQVLDYLEKDSELEPEIKILMGNLQIQRGAYTDAMRSFATVLGRYGPADDELRDMIADPVARARLLEDILALEKDGLAAETRLPRLAAERAKENPEVAEALRIFRDIERSREDIATSRETLERLEAKLTQKDRSGLFKEVASPLIRAKANKTNLLKLEARILDVKRNEAKRMGTQQQKERLMVLTSRTGNLRVKLDRITSDSEEMKQEKQSREAILERMTETMARQKIKLVGVKAQVRAVDDMISAAKQKNNASPLELKNLRSELAFFNQAVRKLEGEETKINRDLRELKAELKVTGGRGIGDSEVRAQFERAAAEENALLDELLGAEKAKYAALEGKVVDMKRRNQTFIDRVEAVVDQRAAAFLVALNQERQNLDQYEAQVEGLAASAAGFKDQATSIALEHVRAVLGKIVIRADVGLVDVSWAKKQEQTSTIAELTRGRAAELTDLNQAYADLTADEVN